MIGRGVTEKVTVKERPKGAERRAYGWVAGAGGRFPRRGNGRRKGPEEEACPPRLRGRRAVTEQRAGEMGRSRDARPFRA